MKVVFRQKRHLLKRRLQWSWTAYGANHEPLARSSESYDNKADCVRGFELVAGVTVPMTGEDGFTTTQRDQSPFGRSIDITFENAR